MANQNTTPAASPNQVGGFLGWIERVGNKIPDITMLFIAAFFITCIVSAICSTIHFGYLHPTTGKEITVTNMLSPQSLVTLMTKMVSNSLLSASALPKVPVISAQV